jgi:hypothetical protein
MPGAAAGMLPSGMARWQFPSIPAFKDFSDLIRVVPGERLLAGLTGVPASSFIALTAIVQDMPLFAQRRVIAVE